MVEQHGVLPDGGQVGPTAAADAPRNLSKRFSTAPRRAMSAMTRMLGAPPAGAVPTGRPSPPARSAVVDCAVYVDGLRQPGEWTYASALETACRHRNGFVWLGLKEPDAAELAEIADVFNLHELATEDAVKSNQRPKVERYGEEMTFCALRTARYVEHAELTENSEVVEAGYIMMFVGQHYVITVRHGDACRLGPVRAGLEKRPELLAQGPWSVAYGIYDSVVDALLDVASAMEEDVDSLEESVFSRQAPGRIQRIYQLKRELLEFKRSVMPLQRPLMSLVSGQVPELSKEMRRYFRDVSDHLTRTVEQVIYFDDLLNSILQARLAQVSVEQNNDMRKIAAWAAIAAVWTAIAGIYGMNFDYMPETHWKYGYPIVLGVMVAASVALYRLLRRSGWL